MTAPTTNNILPVRIPGEGRQYENADTHISRVFIGGEYVYKLKRAINYSFLDFSTLEQRRYYCEREVVLNRRLTKNIYLGVVPVREWKGEWVIDGTDGTIVEYAVKMRRMEPGKRMDLLLKQEKVGWEPIADLASLLGRFHRDAEIIAGKGGSEADRQRELFNDIARVLPVFDEEAGRIARRAMEASDKFLAEQGAILESRRKAGLYRDGHGDLHCRNIFLLEEPQVFDCIEFNDELRQTDVLNDIAFLCMDLDHHGREDLTGLFLTGYAHRFPAAGCQGSRRLLNYYKAYRANIRAKINGLRAASADTDEVRRKGLTEAMSYLRLMDSYRAKYAIDWSQPED